MRSASAVAVSLLAFGPLAVAQAPRWRQLAPAAGGPSVFAPGVACDHLRDRIVLFGGSIAGATPAAGTWEFDGAAWTAVVSATPPPSPRSRPAMVFDARRGETLLFGGLASGSFVADTWTWDGTAWSQRFPLHAPPAFFGPMVYDDVRGVALFFDGASLWEWNGVDWRQLASVHAPPQRRFHAMAFDGRRDRVVLFGGEANGAALADTWEWDGVDWQQVPVAFPLTQGVGLLEMDFDRERGRCVLAGTTLFAGSTPGAPVCCEYDGVSWVVAAALPDQCHAMVADRQQNRMVALVGSVVTNRGTWAYETPGLAIAQPFGTGCGSPAPEVREDASARPVLGQALRANIDDLPAGFAFMAFGWSNGRLPSGPLPLPLRLDAFGLPGCWLLQSSEAILLGCTGTGPSAARFDLPIPAAPVFAGTRFFLQPWAPAPGTNPGGVVLGNGLAVTLGTH